MDQRRCKFPYAEVGTQPSGLLSGKARQRRAYHAVSPSLHAERGSSTGVLERYQSNGFATPMRGKSMTCREVSIKSKGS